MVLPTSRASMHGRRGHATYHAPTRQLSFRERRCFVTARAGAARVPPLSHCVSTIERKRHRAPGRRYCRTRWASARRCKIRARPDGSPRTSVPPRSEKGMRRHEGSFCRANAHRSARREINSFAGAFAQGGGKSRLKVVDAMSTRSRDFIKGSLRSIRKSPSGA